jgi:hypothetical protein
MGLSETVKGINIYLKGTERRVVQLSRMFQDYLVLPLVEAELLWAFIRRVRLFSVATIYALVCLA